MRKRDKNMEPSIYFFKGRRKKRFTCIRVVLKCIFTIAVFGMLGTTVLGGFIVYTYGDELRGFYDDAVTAVADSSATMFEGNQTGYLYDADGNLLTKLKSNKDSEYVKYEDLPESVLNAFVAIEDKRFWEHNGVDWLSTLNAAYLLVQNNGEVKRGGSTITQQLARNVFLSFEVSYERKIREMFTALQLERKYSKKQILEFYVNNINYANQYYGIGAAAKGYFGKNVEELDYGEVAFLCAIPNNPTYYNPRINYEHTIQRRNLILKEMFSQGYLTEKEYLESVNASTRVVAKAEYFYNYETSFAIDCAVRSIMRVNGFNFRYSFDSMTDYELYREGYNSAYDEAKVILSTNGYKVYTSLDSTIQNEAQESVDTSLSEFSDVTEDGVLLIQGAVTVIDNSTGLVVAVVGGRSSANCEAYTLNRAYQGFKQPGSTIKPLIVYTPAMEAGYTPDSIVSDSPIEGGPKNSNNSYSGNIPLRTAVEKSKNVVAWRLFDEITPKAGLSKLAKMQFSRIVPDDYTMAASLGGLTYGVSTVEMASAYACLVNDGMFREPTCIVRIENKAGTNILPDTYPVCVYSRNAAHQMVDILQGVGKRGTAAGLSVGNDMPIACKTGTTNEQKVGWFCGATPYYSVAVYVSADREISIDGLWGNSYPCDIWREIQTYLNRDKEVKQFDVSTQIEMTINGSLSDSGEDKTNSDSVSEQQEQEQPEQQPVPVQPPEQTVQQSEPQPKSQTVQQPESAPQPEQEPQPDQGDLDSLTLE